MAEQTDPSARKRRRFPWWVMWLLLPAILTLLLHFEKNRRDQELRREKKKFAAIVSARPIDKVKAERTRFYETQYYLGYPTSVSYAVADLVRRVDGIARPLRLLGVQVDSGLQELKFKLTIGVAADTPEAALRKFVVFFRGVRDLQGVTQVSYSAPGQARRRGGMHVFSVRGQVEWQ